MIRKLVPILVIALFMLSFAGMAVSQEVQETMTLKGTIISMGADGEVTVQDESGKMTTLTAGSDTDLKILNRGDRVSVEYGNYGVIKSITKQE